MSKHSLELTCPIYILKVSDIDNQKEMIYY